jgi:O-antigen ligase
MALFPRIIDRVVFYGLLALLVVIAIPYGSVQQWWVALFECVVFVFAILASFDLLLTKDALPAGSRVALPLLILCLFLIFQSLPFLGFSNPVFPDLRRAISADPFTTQQLSIKLFALIVAGILLLRYINTESRLRVLTYTVIAIAVCSALFGLLRHGSGGPRWFFPLPKDTRGFAQFVNRNHFGFLVEMAFGLIAGLVIRGTEGYRRWVLAAFAAFLWISLVVANSRGAILATLCQLLFLIVAANPFHMRFPVVRGESRWQMGKAFAVQGLLMIVLVSAFAYGVRWVGGETVVSNFELTTIGFSQQGGHERRENVSRRDVWSATWRLFKAHPVLGSGFGAYWIAITRHHDASGDFTPQEAHNDYLELLAAGGIVGTALCAWFVLLVLLRAIVVLKVVGWAGGAALGAIVGAFGVMVHNVVDFGLHITINAVILMTLIVIIIRVSEGMSESKALGTRPAAP